MSEPSKDSEDTNTAVPPPTKQVTEPSRSGLRKATDFLLENTRTGKLITNYIKHRRYALLKVQDVFNSLVELYRTLIMTQWHHLRRYLEAYELQGTTDRATYAARVYISHWFHDLYASNHHALRSLTGYAFIEHYSHEEPFHSYEYDDFLVLLNASIRPTNIKGTSEDTMFIPLLSSKKIDWDKSSTNPFGITNFNFNHPLMVGMLGIIKERKLWKISPLVTDTTGRPCWLFDWHDEDVCCAWFPFEGNFSMDDVTIAYIIGVACTPNLGPRDIDDWQTFPGNTLPSAIDQKQYKRVVEPRFHGAYQHRTIATQTISLDLPKEAPASLGKKRKKTERPLRIGASESTPATSSHEPEEMDYSVDINQLQIIDWIYYCRVIHNIEPHTRSGALRLIMSM